MSPIDDALRVFERLVRSRHKDAVVNVGAKPLLCHVLGLLSS
jgi:hypothetical protein